MANSLRCLRYSPDRGPPSGSNDGGRLVIDVDATLVGAHSETEFAAPTFKRWFGFHPLWAFCDHGAAGTGEPLAFVLRPGNAGSNTVVHHIAVLRAALAQLPGGHTRGKKVLVRVDGAGGTHELLAWLTPPPAGLLRRVLPAGRCGLDPGQAGDHRRRSMGAGLPRRRPTPPRRLGRRGHRTVHPELVAGGHAGHRSQGTPASGRSCGSPTSTGIESPPSSPTPPAGSSPTLSYGAADGPAARTGSAAPRTPAWPTCRCTT
jgi:hypothetical protein